MNGFFAKSCGKLGHWTEHQVGDLQYILKSIKTAISRGVGKGKGSVAVSHSANAGSSTQAFTQKQALLSSWQQSLCNFKTTLTENASKAQQQMLFRNVLSENACFRNDFIWRRARKGYMIAFAGLFLFQEENEKSTLKLNHQYKIYDNVCSAIHTLFPPCAEESSIPVDCGLQVADFELQNVVQVNENSVTYTATLKPDEDAIEVCSDCFCGEDYWLESWEMCESTDNSKAFVKQPEFSVKAILPVGGIKDVRTLVKQAENELNCGGQDVQRSGFSTKTLPPHPNIVKVERAFIDDVHPNELPKADDAPDVGIFQTLFLVTKRYKTTLKLFRQQEECSGEVLSMIYLQLLEAVAHLEKHNVAHRKIDSENVFVEFDRGGYPRVLLGGFENSYWAPTKKDVCVPFEDRTLDTRTDDLASQAPEISKAQPGRRRVVNYAKSDAWSVGTLGYELLMGRNLFRDPDENGVVFDSREYSEVDLPSLNDVDAPEVMKIVVQMLMSKDPRKRPTAGEVADILHLELFARPPESDLRFADDFLCKELWTWVVAHCAEVFARSNVRNVPFQLCQSFFTRLNSRKLAQSFRLWMLARCDN